MAKRFAAEGASVVVGDINLDGARRVADEIRAQGGTAIAVRVDVVSRLEAQNLVKETLQNFKAIHILVNNAAIFQKKPFLEITEEDWDKVLAVDLKGVFNCTQAVLSHMIRQRYGKIINISSVQGTGTSGTEDYASYAAAKGGVIQLTKVTARVGGPYGINVNCIAPGAILTGIVLDSQGTKDEAEKFIEDRRKLSVLGRLGEPEDIAGLALFLASDDARHMTGQVICMDGGRTDRM
jgi:3-oxoacyl-[acyl-carrier protein] reductase